MKIIEVHGTVDLEVDSPAVELLVVDGAVQIGDLVLTTGAHAIAAPAPVSGDAILAVMPLPLPTVPRLRRLDSFTWQQARAGVHRATLLHEHGYWTRLTRIAPRTLLEAVHIPDGEHLLVLDGDLHDDDDHHLGRLDLVVYPAGSIHEPRSDGGCMLLVRSPIPPRPVVLATVLLHVAAIAADDEAVAAYSRGAYFAAPIDDLDTDRLCDDFFGVEYASREDHVREVEGAAGVESFHLAALAASIEAFATLAPGRTGGPAFRPCLDARARALADLAARPALPLALAFAADLAARLRDHARTR